MTNLQKIHDLPAGRYVIAVSGGVDSMALLDMLRRRPELELIVAHVNHGIRSDAIEDEELVSQYSMSHNIIFTCKQLSLGQGASEERARQERYKFLRHTRKTYGALGIVLAHHQDDLLETAVINLLRGTGRRGLGALRSHDDLVRPLLDISKASLIEYAKEWAVPWREDSTNQDQTYLRNFVRHSILANASAEVREKLLTFIVRQSQLDQEIDSELAYLHKEYATVNDQAIALPRYPLIMLPRQVLYELLQYTMRGLTGNTIEKTLAEHAMHFVKTARLHKRFTLGKMWQLRIEHHLVIVEHQGYMIK